MKNCIVICGPTASGKTALAVSIAASLGGEIISCDSRQVYRGMDIGTGKDLAEYHSHGGTVAYHLIDIVEPSDVYTVYRYQRDFYRVFQEIRSRRRLPIVAGGTGLYLEAVLRGYDIPEVPEDQELRQSLMLKEKTELEQELKQISPDLQASTDCSSKKRIVRGIEIALARKEKGNRPGQVRLPIIHPVVLCVTWAREKLRERIRARMLARFEAGMVDEVKRLLDAGISRDRLAMFGMEYRHIGRYLAGEVDYETMTADLLHDIRQLAKRQETWFSGMERRGIKIHWVKDADAAEAMRIIGAYSFENTAGR